MNSKIKQALKLVLTIGIILFVFSKIGFEDVYKTIQKTDLRIYCLALVTLFVGFVPATLQWDITLKKFGKKIPKKELIKYTLMSYPFMLVSPAKTGDLVRAWFLKKERKVKLQVGIASIIVQRLFDLTSLTIIACISIILFIPKIINIGILPQIIAVLALVSIFILPNKKVITTIIKPFKKILRKFEKTEKFHTPFGEFYENMLEILTDKKLLATGICLGFMNWLIFYTQTKICFLAFGVNVPLHQIFALSSFASLSVILPITISGFGVREGVSVLLYSLVNIPKEITLSAILLAIMTNYTIMTTIGSILLLKSNVKVAKKLQ